MIALIKAFIAYFFFPKHRYKPVPRQIINEYDRKQMNEASEAEQLLMMKNKARSPMAAKHLLKKHKTEAAHEVLAKLPKRKYTTPKERLMRLIGKIVGHDERDPYRVNVYDKDRL